MPTTLNLVVQLDLEVIESEWAAATNHIALQHNTGAINYATMCALMDRAFTRYERAKRAAEE